MTPFAIFFLRQFFLGINKEIEEAAKLDGAGHWRIFFRIILPMSSAPIITLFILTFINMWNDYFWPFLVGTNETDPGAHRGHRRVPVPDPAGSPDWAGLMAAVLVAALPILILFLALRQEGRQLDRLLRREVTASPSIDPTLGRPSAEVTNRKDLPTMAKLRKKWAAALVGAAALSLTLTACGGGGRRGRRWHGSEGGGDRHQRGAPGEINYWLWDNAQLAGYQKCADDFKAANPNVNVKISQFAWDDYWSKLTNGFVAGDAPDVFTNHLAKYPEFVTQQQLVPLDDTLAKDGFNADQYQPGLADLWKGQDGKRYGLPKDFDTVALFYNKKLADDGGSDRRRSSDQLSLEPHRRRHLREGHRPPDRRRERQARRRGRLRQEQGQGLRPRASTAAPGRASVRPSGACTPARPAWSSSPTRTRGAPTTTTTTRSSRRPSAGSSP